MLYKTEGGEKKNKKKGSVSKWSERPNRDSNGPNLAPQEGVKT